MGLFGQEGLQAVQNSDFGLANFRYLWKLILVEGRMNHMRISKFTLIFLYKNIVFTMAQFLFGFYCNWSAQSIYDDWYITNYNLIFTAMTISYLGTFEQDIRYREYLPKEEVEQKKKLEDPIINKKGEILAEDEDLESIVPLVETKVYRSIKDIYQHFYYTSQKNIYFNLRIFAQTTIEGILHSGIIMFMMIYNFQKRGIDSEGRSSDMWTVSLSLYSNLIFITNVLTLIRAAHITFLLGFAIVLTSLVPFFLFVVYYDRWTSWNLYSTYSMRFILQCADFYLVCIVCTMGVCFIEICKFFLKFYTTPSLVEYVLKLKKLGFLGEEKYFKRGVIEIVKEKHLRKLEGYEKKTGTRAQGRRRNSKLVERVTLS